MKRESVLLTVFLTFLVASSSLAFGVARFESSGTVYIRADGSIDPPAAPISTVDNVTYILTGNITSDAHGIVVERDNIVIDGSGFTVRGDRSYLPNFSGIYLSQRGNVTIRSTSVQDFWSGIWLNSSSGNSISGNNITNNMFYGIWLACSSDHNSISRNNITNNSPGIYLGESSNSNYVNGNAFIDDGLSVWLSFANIVENNTVNGRPLVYLEGIKDYSVADAGQVVLVRCDRIRVQELNLSRTYIGVQLSETNNSIISGNNIADNSDYGISLFSSANNSISGNIIARTHFFGWDGIWLNSSANNRITENTITDNIGGIGFWSSSDNAVNGNSITNNGNSINLAYSYNNSISGNDIANNQYGVCLFISSNNSIIGNNITDNGEYGISFHFSLNAIVYHNNFNNAIQVDCWPPQYGSFWDNGCEGNYWSNYNGTDANHDGIGDTPYVIDANNADNYPLMTQYIIPEFASFLILPLFFLATLLAVATHRRKHRGFSGKHRKKGRCGRYHLFSLEAVYARGETENMKPVNKGIVTKFSLCEKKGMQYCSSECQNNVWVDHA